MMERKREEIRCKFQEEELERIRVSNSKYEENCRNKLKDIVEATLKKYQTIKMIEDFKFSKEIQQKKMKQKTTIIENINNYYDNKMKMLREQMLERKSYKQIFDLEHKIICAEAERSRKKELKILHEKNKNLLKKQIENIELGTKLEIDTIFEKIIKLYKKSRRIMPQNV